MTPLDRLRQLVPPPASVAGHDWAATEQGLGRRIPQDFKELADAYGRGYFDGHFHLLVPRAEHDDLVCANESHMDNLNHFWSNLVECPAELAAVDDLLLVDWAETIDADTLNWLVTPGVPPERWPVAVIDADLGECELYPMTSTEFLAGLFSGDVDSEIITHHLQATGHEFHPYPGADVR